MAEGKKISFGFSKLSKQPKLNSNKPNGDNIEFIDYLDSRSIKIRGLEEKYEKSEIIIPLYTSSSQKGNTLIQVIKNATASDTIRQPVARLTDSASNQQNDLDSIAARELIEEASNSQKRKTDDQTTFSLPMQSGSAVDTEATLDDYDAVPVSKFGIAMLRGMGWNPTRGIGKDGKLITMVEPKVRPRGMGLGVAIQRHALTSSKPASISKPEEELKIVKGAYIQVTSGPHRELYGQIEGFNEETGRLIIKLALGSTSISLNEYMVKPVSKDEFTKNSRVLNAAKYETYKCNESQGKPAACNGTTTTHSRSPSHSSSSSPRPQHKRPEERLRDRSQSRSPDRDRCDFKDKERRGKKSRS